MTYEEIKNEIRVSRLTRLACPERSERERRLNKARADIWKAIPADVNRKAFRQVARKLEFAYAICKDGGSGKNAMADAIREIFEVANDANSSTCNDKLNEVVKTLLA